MKVHIKVVVSTAGNDEEYVGKHFGQLLLDRPLSRTVVTFEEEVTEKEFTALRQLSTDIEFREGICERLAIEKAIKVHSFSVTRNINN